MQSHNSKMDEHNILVDTIYFFNGTDKNRVSHECYFKTAKSSDSSNINQKRVNKEVAYDPF